MQETTEHTKNYPKCTKPSRVCLTYADSLVSISLPCGDYAETHLWASRARTAASSAERLATSISRCLLLRSTPRVRMPSSSRSSCQSTEKHVSANNLLFLPALANINCHNYLSPISISQNANTQSMCTEATMIFCICYNSETTLGGMPFIHSK